jgi:phosphatidylserine/phosphatidylglycerophosphate/cardiolipin synthase-like enzyme
MVSLSTAARVLHAVEHARNVTFGAYLLPPGAMREALENAARRGAKVHVRLDGSPYGSGNRGIAKLNKQAIKELRKSGVDAELVRGAESGLHMKAVICDSVAYLDDRNFAANGTQTILRDDSRADVAKVGNALLHDDARPGRELALRKNDALRAEASLIRDAHRGDTIEVQSEFFGGTWVSSALHAAAKRGVHCKLGIGSKHKMKPHERAVLQGLVSGGVNIRLVTSAEKFAVLNGKRAWVGSADATYNPHPQRDWGIRTNDAAIARSVHRTFAHQWRSAKALSFC